MEIIKNKYLISGFLKSFIIASFGFLSLFFILQILGDLPSIIRSNQEINIKIYLFQIPKMFVQISPIITFLTSAFLISEMLKYHEIRVLEISGIFPFKIYSVILTGGLLITGFVFYCNDVLSPVFLKKMHPSKVITKMNFSAPDLFFYSEKFVFPDYLENLQISRTLPDKSLMVIKGKRARYLQGIWEIYNGKYWVFDSEGIFGKEKSFSKMRLEIPLEPDVIWKTAKSTDEISIKELKYLITKLKKLNLFPVGLQVNLQEKIAYPFLNFFIILASIPFFFWREKISRFLVLSFSMLCSFLCYVLYSTGIAFAKSGKLPVFLGVWLVHILILLTAVVFFVKLHCREKSYIIKRKSGEIKN